MPRTRKRSHIEPASVVVREALDEIGKALKTKGITLERWLARGRKLRGQLVKEKYGLTAMLRAEAEAEAGPLDYN